MGEDSTGRGGGHSAQPSLWVRPCQGGQLTKGVSVPPQEYILNPATVLQHFRWENPQTCVGSGGDGSAEGDLRKTHSYLTGWRRCRHWRFRRSQRLTDSLWGGTSTYHPTSTQLGILFGRMDLLFCLFCLFDYVIFFYGLVFAEALLWTFHRIGHVKSCCRFRLFFLKWYCLPSVVDFIARALLQQGVPRDRKNV